MDSSDETLGLAPPLERLDRLIWAVIGAVAAIVLVAPVVSSFFLKWPTFATPAVVALLLIGGAWFYRHRRPDPRIASGLENTAQLIAFAAVAAPLSYLAAAANLPLQDAIFDHIDRALGLDWRGLLNWMNASPITYAILRPIYLSLTFQMTTAVLALAFSGHLLRLRVYMLSVILAALITIAISTVLPAAGVWPYYNLTAADSPHVMPAVSTSWPVFYGLRDGGLRALVAIGSEGIISFPSLHAALAIILTMALWPVPILRWAIVALNIAMLAGTPIDGSHYFTDVFAGASIGALCFLVIGRIVARYKERDDDSPVSMVPSPVASE
jgi:membrane-associated phospholipid phosphatase